MFILAIVSPILAASVLTVSVYKYKKRRDKAWIKRALASIATTSWSKSLVPWLNSSVADEGDLENAKSNKTSRTSTSASSDRTTIVTSGFDDFSSSNHNFLVDPQLPTIFSTVHTPKH